jgi:lipoprotein-releasing system permease protein
VLAILGIATGVLALTVIIAVMNGFQLGFIESILEVSSYHVRLQGFPPDQTETLAAELGRTPGVIAAVPFCEFQGLIRGRRNSQHALMVRGMPLDATTTDRGLAEKLEFESGAFDVSDRGSILLGAELARALTVRLGDEVTLFSINDLFGGGNVNSGGDEEAGLGVNTFTVKGIFRTGYYEYDLGLALVSLETGLQLSGAERILGFKLRDRWQDAQARETLSRAAGTDGDGSPLRWSSWREYNKAFFGALRTEKLFMFILVGLIFIVVGLNIFQAQRRAVLERREEIGLLRAVGAGETAVRLVFVWDGFLIGFCGAGIGLLLGILVATHIGAVFNAVEWLVNRCLEAVNYLSGSFSTGGNFSVFSPAVFYIKGIPSRVIPHEAFLIFMFGFLSALLAAWFASGKVSRTKPAEVLRDE